MASGGAMVKNFCVMDGWGQRIKDRAEELGISGAEVARRAGIPERNFGHYSIETNQPTFSDFCKICQALETTPNQILGFRSVVDDDLLAAAVGALMKYLEQRKRRLPPNEMADAIAEIYRIEEADEHTIMGNKLDEITSNVVSFVERLAARHKKVVISEALGHEPREETP